MTRAICVFPMAILALSLIPSVSKAYAADTLVTSDTPVPATPRALTPGLLPAEPAALALLPAYRSVEQSAAEAAAETKQENHVWHKRWLISLAPLVASQALDAASSWGLREENPILAGPDGRFGMKATSIKFGVIGGLVGAEYLLVRKFPASGKFFTVVNYATAGATTGLAVHNYALPGR